MDMEEIQNNPTDALVTLWSRKWAILIFTLIVTGVVALGSFLLPPLPEVYEAKATVLVFPAPYPYKQKQVGFLRYDIGSLSVNSYKDLVMAPGNLQVVIDRLITNHPNIKNSLFPKTLEKMISIDMGDANGSQALPMSFRVQGQNPLLIRDIANTIANLLSELSGQIKKSKIKNIADTTNTQFVSVKKRLSDAEKTLNTIRVENKLPSLLDELRSMKERLGVYNYQLTVLEGQLNTESSKLAAYKETKSELPEFIKTELVRTEINYKTLLAKKKLLTESIKQLKKRIPRLQNKIRVMELKEKQISRKTKALEEQFFWLSNNAHETLIAEAGKTGDIKVVSKAVEPHFPVPSNKEGYNKVILTALVLSLMVGTAIALAKEHLDTARQNTKK